MDGNGWALFEQNKPVPWDQANHSPYPGTHPTDLEYRHYRRHNLESLKPCIVTLRDTSQVEARGRMQAVLPTDG